jgi:hypothetical protein
VMSEPTCTRCNGRGRMTLIPKVTAGVTTLVCLNRVDCNARIRVAAKVAEAELRGWTQVIEALKDFNESNPGATAVEAYKHLESLYQDRLPPPQPAPRQCSHSGHPSTNCYVGHGCRCLACREEHRVYMLPYRKPYVPRKKAEAPLSETEVERIRRELGIKLDEWDDD